MRVNKWWQNRTFYLISSHSWCFSSLKFDVQTIFITQPWFGPCQLSTIFPPLSLPCLAHLLFFLLLVSLLSLHKESHMLKKFFTFYRWLVTWTVQEVSADKFKYVLSSHSSCIISFYIYQKEFWIHILWTNSTCLLTAWICGCCLFWYLKVETLPTTLMWRRRLAQSSSLEL